MINTPTLSNLFKKDGIKLSNISENIGTMLIASAFSTCQKTIFVVLDTLYQAQKYYDRLINMLNEEDVLFYPADELITSELLVSSIEFKVERISTINTLLKGQPKIVVTNLNGIIRKQIKKENWINASYTFKTGDDLNINSLTKYLIEFGYKKEYTVSKIGEFSIRGSIIDIFPINSLNPIRLDLFDTEIEKIKEFNINTQRSIKSVENVEIIPLNEMFYNDEELEIIKSFIKNINSPTDKEKEILDNDLEALINRNNVSLLRKYIGLISNETILDFISDKKIFFIDENKIKESFKKTEEDLLEYLDNIEGNNLRNLEYFINLFEIENNYKINYLEEFNSGNGKTLNIRDSEKFYGNIEGFLGYLNQNQKAKRIIIAFKSNDKLKRLKEEMLERNINYEMYKNQDYNGIFLTLDSCATGLDFYKDNLIIFSEEDIYKRIENKVRYKSVYGESKRVKSVDDLKIGDYVVHYDYGIGRYLGIETRVVSRMSRDFIKILYAGNEFYYTPLENIDSIMKYTNANTPKLSKLGGTSWAKAKEKIRQKAKDISDKLIKLYSERDAAKGFAYSANNELHELFSSDFEYEETEDQIEAIKDVTSDMEKTKPMDRLICGDVGYGKTEIAMRGAFKAYFDHKQVAFLAPTTVLVNQHYNSFFERFNKYGVVIRKLSRLNTPKETKEILKELKEGKIDILIGTHRILSKDIEFKDLGLLIIDEEQRFGVEHKERIKEMKVNVDCISLTATPIPRTLQMSLVGIKDLSVINTPPKNRYPVQTYVVAYHKTIVKEAIERELARGGQVFYLHNRVNDIETTALEIQNLVPFSRVSFAHGRMSKEMLEDRIEDFIERKSNVLVCTTIIETGIDIPNANTLIIDDATRLGLSQLYQLRGRVGRSDRIAYAYLFYDEGKVMTSDARERLDAIRDFTELGSGFKIAKRDLAIRGSGDILGADQSGFIDTVGYDMYMRILKEAIQEKTEKPQEEKFIPIFSDRHIPQTYINDDGVRIDVHKRISQIKSEEDVITLEEELRDRFGNLNDRIKVYMYEKMLDNYIKKLDIEITNKENSIITLSFTPNGNEANLFKLTMKYGKALKIKSTRTKLNLEFDAKQINGSWIIELAKFLEAYSKTMN